MLRKSFAGLDSFFSWFNDAAFPCFKQHVGKQTDSGRKVGELGPATELCAASCHLLVAYHATCGSPRHELQLVTPEEEDTPCWTLPCRQEKCWNSPASLSGVVFAASFSGRLQSFRPKHGPADRRRTSLWRQIFRVGSEPQSHSLAAPMPRGSLRARASLDAREESQHVADRKHEDHIHNHECRSAFMRLRRACR